MQKGCKSILFNIEIQFLEKQENMIKNSIICGILYFNKDMINYIYNKDIMDIVAWIGDSLLVFDNVTYRTIFSYEISHLNIIRINKTLRNNKLSFLKHKITQKGLSNFHGVSYIKNTGSALELIKVGKYTITKYLPILSISIYHNFVEYFEVRKYLDSITSSYKYKYILSNLYHTNI